MAFYECTFIARQDVSVQDVQRLSDKFVEIFKEYGGKLIKKEYWGLRSLAYIVKKNKKGHYVMLGVEATPQGVAEFERNCKINEDVLKWLTIRVEELDESPSLMMQAPAKITPGAAIAEDLI